MKVYDDKAKIAADNLSKVLEWLDNTQSWSRSIKEESGQLLPKLNKKQLSETLLGILSDTNIDSSIRVRAVKSLGKLKSTDAVLPLIQSALNDTDFAIRCWTITALGDIGDKRATQTLIDLLLNDAEELRIKYHAAHALGKLADPASVLPLVEILKTAKDEDIKEYITTGLFHIDANSLAFTGTQYSKDDPVVQKRFRLLESSD